VAGLVPASRKVHDSITKRKPVLVLDPFGPPSWEIRRVAERLLAHQLPGKRLVTQSMASAEADEPDEQQEPSSGALAAISGDER
jgi:hypothetical protein